MSVSDVIDFRREQFARTNARIENTQYAMMNRNVRMTGLMAESGDIRIGLADVNRRFDRMDGRIAQVSDVLCV